MRILFTYRALFRSLGIDTSSVRTKTFAVRVLRIISALYFVAALFVLTLRSISPWWATWSVPAASELSRFMTLACIAIIINPIRSPVFGDIRPLDTLEGHIAPTHRVGDGDDQLGDVVLNSHADLGARLQKGDVAVIRLPATAPNQRPRFAYCTRHTDSTEPPPSDDDGDDDAATS
jgi:hypothetical protein